MLETYNTYQLVRYLLYIFGLPIISHINNNSVGFKTSKEACCGQGPLNGMPGFCSATSNLCKNRDEYVFWDAFHPTERACRLIVQQIMNGTQEYMKPVNLNFILSDDQV